MAHGEDGVYPSHGRGSVKLTREAAPREAGPWEAGPWEAAPREAAPREAAPREAGPREAAPREAGPRLVRCRVRRKCAKRDRAPLGQVVNNHREESVSLDSGRVVRDHVQTPDREDVICPPAPPLKIVMVGIVLLVTAGGFVNKKEYSPVAGCVSDANPN